MKSRAIGAAVALVAVAAIAWWWWGTDPDRDSTAPSTVEPAHTRPQPVGATADGRSIAGTVLLDGAPAAGVTVRVTRQHGTTWRTTTDAAGHFEVTRLAAASYHVVADKPHVTGAFTTTDLRDPTADSEHLVLVLHACTASVHGNVRDAAGGPIAGARIAVSADAREQANGADSDTDGNYELCLAPGWVLLIARADGYAQVSTSVAASARVRRDFLLAPEATVTGRVVRADDHAPVAGAIVQVEPDFTAATSSAVLFATSDDDGWFRLAGATVGRHMLTASAPGLVTPRAVPVLAEVGKPEDDLVCELVQTAHVAGTVSDGTRPVPGAKIRLFAKRGSSLDLEAISNSDGAFAFDHVPAGNYAPVIDGYELDTKELVVPGTGLDGVQLRVSLLASISGRIMRDGQPVDAARVRAENHEALSGSDGRYTVRGLRPGTYQMYAESLRVGAFTNGPKIVVAKAEQRTGVDLALDLDASIAGRVVDQDNAAVSGAVVSFSLLHGRDFGTATTAEDGTFTTTGLSGGGAYTFQITDGNANPKPYSLVDGRRPVPIAVADAHARVRDVVIKVGRHRGSIAGRVTTDRDEPLPDVIVRADYALDGNADYRYGYYGYGLGVASATTDATGAFTIRDLPDGTWGLHALSTRGEQDLTNIATGTTNVVIKVPEAATIEGKLDGFARGAEVGATSADGMRFTAAIHGSTFKIRGLTAGMYDVIASGPDGYDAQSVTVAAGARSQVTLHRKPLGSITGTVLTSDTHQPVAGLACRSGSSTTDADAVTDARGAFRLDDVTPGETMVVCRADPVFAAGRAVVSSGQATNVDLVTRTMTMEPRSNAGFDVESQFEETLVSAVDPGGPAEKAGIQVGDVIVTIDDTPMWGYRGRERLEMDSPGTVLSIVIERADKQQKIALTLAPR